MRRYGPRALLVSHYIKSGIQESAESASSQIEAFSTISFNAFVF